MKKVDKKFDDDTLKFVIESSNDPEQQEVTTIYPPLVEGESNPTSLTGETGETSPVSVLESFFSRKNSLKIVKNTKRKPWENLCKMVFT